MKAVSGIFLPIAALVMLSCQTARQSRLEGEGLTERHWPILQMYARTASTSAAALNDSLVATVVRDTNTVSQTMGVWIEGKQLEARAVGRIGKLLLLKYRGGRFTKRSNFYAFSLSTKEQVTCLLGQYVDANGARVITTVSAIVDSLTYTEAWLRAAALGDTTFLIGALVFNEHRQLVGLVISRSGNLLRVARNAQIFRLEALSRK